MTKLISESVKEEDLMRMPKASAGSNKVGMEVNGLTVLADPAAEKRMQRSRTLLLLAIINKNAGSPEFEAHGSLAEKYDLPVQPLLNTPQELGLMRTPGDIHFTKPVVKKESLWRKMKRSLPLVVLGLASATLLLVGGINFFTEPKTDNSDFNKKFKLKTPQTVTPVVVDSIKTVTTPIVKDTANKTLKEVLETEDVPEEAPPVDTLKNETPAVPDSSSVQSTITRLASDVDSTLNSNVVTNQMPLTDSLTIKTETHTSGPSAPAQQQAVSVVTPTEAKAEIKSVTLQTTSVDYVDAAIAMQKKATAEKAAKDSVKKAEPVIHAVKTQPVQNKTVQEESKQPEVKTDAPNQKTAYKSPAAVVVNAIQENNGKVDSLFIKQRLMTEYVQAIVELGGKKTIRDEYKAMQETRENINDQSRRAEILQRIEEAKKSIEKKRANHDIIIPSSLANQFTF